MLERNKEFFLNIPVLIDATDCVFHIKVNPGDGFENQFVCFLFNNLKTDKRQVIEVQIQEEISIINLSDINKDLSEKYFFVGCTSKKNIRFQLSIQRKHRKTTI